ncbi:hypothetical protein FRB99_006291 [Tulasnella sp. 403]|nr:hypothetical protein FRB99_006291 [Tulasnella sp. 403]
MKLSLAFLPFLAISAFAGVYVQDDEPASKPSPTPSKGLFNLPSFDLEGILTSGPVASLIAKTGINITERLAAAKKEAAETGWDPRIPLITDENYRKLVVEEPLGLDELEQRVWFLLVSIPNADPISKFVDSKFDAAFNLTMSAPEMALPHVRWGRINYLEVTEITTRWWIWKAPMLVVLRKGGQELRFYTARQLRLAPESIHKFLEIGGWNETPAWSGMFAPGGSAESSMETIAVWAGKAYKFSNSVPRWIMLMGTGALASFLIGLMHRAAPSNPPRRVTATATNVGETKKADKTSPLRQVHKQRSPSKEGSPSPSKRQSARLQAKKN